MHVSIHYLSNRWECCILSIFPESVGLNAILTFYRAVKSLDFDMEKKMTIVFVILILSFGCSSPGLIPVTIRPASFKYVDQQITELFHQLEKERQQSREQIQMLDSLLILNRQALAKVQQENLELSSQLSSSINDKDNEINKLQMQIANLNKLLGNYDMIMDSLLQLSNQQTKVYEKLYAIDQTGDDSTAQSFKEKQLLFVQNNLDSLKHSYSKLVNQQRNLYQDLSIVESSIMDIMQFSFNKAAQQINDKYTLLESQYLELKAVQDSMNSQKAQTDAPQFSGNDDFIQSFQIQLDLLRHDIELLKTSFTADTSMPDIQNGGTLK
ncbi:MAG TPA: hypothetical protein ENN84_09715 [Candidatus Marinimicrobia bacterium]|nr:hypothetical protein [Candidatus Neomarinimicrobiota bacterium]